MRLGRSDDGKLHHETTNIMANFYFDGHIRYAESKDIMMTALRNGIIRDRHTTYLCPQPF